MSISKADDVAFVRFSAPDLGLMRRFLDDFGMAPAADDSQRLFVRGRGPAPFVHATSLGPPGFAGFGIRMNAEEDLERLAAHDGVAIEDLDAPGGGRRVRLTDPDGFVVEAVTGQSMAHALPSPPAAPWNESNAHARVADFRRAARGPAHVLRLGHVVLSVRDFRASEKWYKSRFGLITSDEIEAAPGLAIGAFMRCDRGDAPSDHHAVFLIQRPEGPGFIHAAFEVAGLDDLMAGRDHLLAAGWRPTWGVGRHILGSQVFDYWSDPWGHEVEHWTDGDQLRARDGGGVATMAQLMGVQWGMASPHDVG